MSTANLRTLPAGENLGIIEALWGVLAVDEGSLVSPAWPEEALRRTEADFAAGRIQMVDCDDAQEELWKRLMEVRVLRSAHEDLADGTHRVRAWNPSTAREPLSGSGPLSSVER